MADTTPKLIPPIEGMTVIPLGIKCGYDAWVGFCVLMLSDKEALKEFKETSGVNLEALNIPPRTGLEQLIDKASGYDEHVRMCFVKWLDFATINYWGIEETEN